MTEIQAGVRLDLKGNLERHAQRYGRSLQKFSRTGERHLSRLRRVAGSAGSALDRVGNRWTALITGAGVAATARHVIGLDERFTRLGINAGRSAAEIEELKKRIFDVAQSPDIRFDPGQITSAIEQVVEFTGDLQFAEDNIRNIGLALQATGGSGEALGKTFAEFQKMGLNSTEAVLKAMDLLIVQGKEGAFTAQNMAEMGPRLFAAYGASGRGGHEAVKEVGAVIQMIRQGTGSAEMATTAFEAVMRTLNDKKKITMLQGAGIQIYEDAEQEIMRPLNEIMEELVQKTGGRASALSSVFDAEAIRAFNAMIAEFKRTGAVQSIDRYLNVHADGTQIVEDSARAADTASAALQNLRTAWSSFADDNLAGPIQSAADALNSMDPDHVKLLMDAAKWGAIGLGGAYVARKVHGLGRGAADVFRRGGGGRGGGAGGAVGDILRAGRPIPVYVVNSMGGIDGPGGGGKNRRRPANRVRRPSNLRMVRAAPNLRTIAAMGAGAMSTTALALAAAGAAGYGLGTLINEQFVEPNRELSDTIGRSVAKTLAFFGNDEAQAALAAEKKAQQMNGTIRIEFDGQGRPRAKEIRSDTPGLDLDVYNGPSLGAL